QGAVSALPQLLVEGLAPRQASVTLSLKIIQILLELAIVGCHRLLESGLLIGRQASAPLLICLERLADALEFGLVRKLVKMALGSAGDDDGAGGATAPLRCGLVIECGNCRLVATHHGENFLLERLAVTLILNAHARPIKSQLLGLLAVLPGHG